MGIWRNSAPFLVQDNGKTSHQRFLHAKDFNACHQNLGFKTINDTLFEASCHAPAQGAFHHTEAYRYCSIKNGEVMELPSNRSFAFTQYVAIDSTYFKGCWWRKVEAEEPTNEMLSYNHLLPEDLDIMRNEIYADYGYRFQSPKWQQYFKQFDWYKPRYDNVDNQITPLEKANIDYILRHKRWLEQHRDEVIKTETIDWSPAG